MMCTAYAVPRKQQSLDDFSGYYAVANTRNRPDKRKLILESETFFFSDCNDNGVIVPDGTCSDNQPLYCNSGELISKATICGCPEGFLPAGEICVFDESLNYPIIPLIINGPKNRKLDLLFLKDRYGDNHDKFEQDVQASIDTLFTIEPYASNDFRYNIYIAEDNPSLGCQPSGANGITCNYTTIRKFLNYHNLDKAIVLVNDFEGRGASNSSDLSFASVLREGWEYAVAHEHTHQHNIRDEYVYLGDYTGPPPEPSFYRNCLPSLQQCEDLRLEIPEVRCFEDGCIHSNWIRTRRQSLMSCSSNAKADPRCRVLSPLAEKLVREELEKYN